MVDCPTCLRDELNALKRSSLAVIGSLVVAVHREGWEEGPTINEANDLANTWYYAHFGYGGKAASQALEAAGLEASK